MAAHALDELDTARSSDFKKTGWRGVFERLRQSPQGALTVTNHQRAEAVILTLPAYELLLRQANDQERQHDDVLETLRSDFDRRLETLKQGGLGDRMRDAMREPLDLHGEFRVGDSH